MDKGNMQIRITDEWTHFGLIEMHGSMILIYLFKINKYYFFFLFFISMFKKEFPY